MTDSEKATPEGLLTMDAAAIAFARARARQSGLSLKAWLEQLVFQQAAVLRRKTFYGGGPPVAVDPWQAGIAGSLSIGATIASSSTYDYWRSLQLDLFPNPYPSSVASSVMSNPFGNVAAPHDEAMTAFHMIALFPVRIDYAAVLLSAAFGEEGVDTFRPALGRRKLLKQPTHYRWYSEVVHTCVHRSREVRNALRHHWEPKGRAERLAIGAFVALSDLTPASQELATLCQHDRPRAFSELAKQLDIVTQQFELWANLLAEVEVVEGSAHSAEERRFAELRAALLEKAGGGLSLTEAAGWLDMSRQALHKRIKSGSALGMMNGTELVLPRVQWIEAEGAPKFLPGLAEILKLFETAGGWSALQFLVESDPNLATTPREALVAGRIDQVLNAAQAYLDMDEE
jgi:hypothetical protein